MIWDVAVVGAGPAGSVAALVLARAGCQVLLLEAGPAPAFKVGESLPAAAGPILRDLGVADRIKAGPHRPCPGALSIWGDAQPVAVDSIRDPHGAGLHLDRPTFDATLRQAATEAGASWIEAKLRTVERTNQGFQFQTSNGEHVAKRLIDATGRTALVARSLGETRTNDDDLVALCVWTQPNPSDREARTLIEAVPDGWWYSARLPDQRRVTVYHTDADQAGVTKSQESWLQALSQTSLIAKAMQPYDLETEPKTTPARGGMLSRCTGDGWLAVGDAALSFDPLSSQGIFNALYTGLRGAQALQADLKGDTQALPTYQRRLDSVRQAYLRHHRVYYQSERRWPDRRFWAGRHG